MIKKIARAAVDEAVAGLALLGSIGLAVYLAAGLAFTIQEVAGQDLGLRFGQIAHLGFGWLKILGPLFG